MKTTDRDAQLLAREYLRFMRIKVKHGYLEPGEGVAPSRMVDQVWHSHILDTQPYAVLQEALLPAGGFMHHNPLLSEQPDYEKRLAHCLNLYMRDFGEEPDESAWQLFDECDVKLIRLQVDIAGVRAAASADSASGSVATVCVAVYRGSTVRELRDSAAAKLGLQNVGGRKLACCVWTAAFRVAT